MAAGILQASVQNRGLVLDPRTKLMMLFNIALFVLGSAGGGSVEPLVPVLCFMPAVPVSYTHLILLQKLSSSR